MRIAVINESAGADRNSDILAALEGSGHDIINAGMKSSKDSPVLSYIHTGLLAALLLNTKRADYIIGGCGTGQGFFNSCMQYPGVFCGFIANPLDAWLFTQINGGNCVSLMYTLNYGWAADINIKFIVERLFSVESGSGYPAQRSDFQAKSRRLLTRISSQVHLPFCQIIRQIEDDALLPLFDFPGILDIIDVNTIDDKEIKEALLTRIK